MADLLMVLFRRSHSTNCVAAADLMKMRSEKVRRHFLALILQGFGSHGRHVATAYCNAMSPIALQYHPVYLANTIYQPWPVQEQHPNCGKP